MKRCTKCGIDKELSEYYFHTLRGKFVPHSACKSCHIKMVEKYKISHPTDNNSQRKWSRTYYAKNKETIIANNKSDYPKNKGKISIHNKKYYQLHRESLLENSKIYRNNNKEVIRIRRKNYHRKYGYNPNTRRKYYMRNKERIKVQAKNKRLEIKTEVITHYGNGECKCIRCGFTDIRALSIDHINGNGNQHRKENQYLRGNHVYEWLKKNQFPQGYQTLCMNCQLIKRNENQEYRYKPHANPPYLQLSTIINHF
jgi:hypothetical protein